MSMSPPVLPSQPDDDNELISFGTTEDRFDLSEVTATIPTHTHNDDDIELADAAPSPHITPPPLYSSTTVPTSQMQQEAELAIPPSHGEAPRPTPTTTPNMPTSHEVSQNPQTDAEMSDAASAPRPPSSASSAEVDIADYIASKETLEHIADANPIPQLDTTHGLDYGMHACVQHLTTVKNYIATNRRLIHACITEPTANSADALCANDFWSSVLTAVDQITCLISYIAPNERRHIDACTRAIKDIIMDAVVVSHDLSMRQRLLLEARTIKNPQPIASFRQELHTSRSTIDEQTAARQCAIDAAEETEQQMSHIRNTHAKGKAVNTATHFAREDPPSINPSQCLDLQPRTRLFSGVPQPGPTTASSPDPTPVTAVWTWAEGLPPTTLHEPRARLIDRLSTPFPGDRPTHHDTPSPTPMEEDNWDVVLKAPEPAAITTAYARDTAAPKPAIQAQGPAPKQMNKCKMRESPKLHVPMPAPAPIVLLKSAL